MSQLKGVCVGAGYFSHFQYEAWDRIPEVEITGVCNRHLDKAVAMARKYGIEQVRQWKNLDVLLDQTKPDFIDIITPPETHLEVVQLAARKGINVICQKPLAPTLEQSRQLVDVAKNAGIRFLVHENWRWQPWYREIKRQLDTGILGQLYRSRCACAWVMVGRRTPTRLANHSFATTRVYWYTEPVCISWIPFVFSVVRSPRFMHDYKSEIQS